MKVIGLTGGIGAGKSVVARVLRELGAWVIDADSIGHEAYKPGTSAWQAVVEIFGRKILRSNGEVDRKRLGTIVFNDAGALNRLNSIMHPRIYRMVEEQLGQLQRKGTEVAVLEAAILIEAGWTPLVDELWVVTAPEDEVVGRLHGRSGLTEKQVRARIRSQLTAKERIRRADVVIVNDAGLEELQDKVHELWRSRINWKV